MSATASASPSSTQNQSSPASPPRQPSNQRPQRSHGLECPFDLLQIIAIFVYALFILGYVILYIPLLPNAGVRAAISVILGVLGVSSIVLYILAAGRVADDPLIHDPEEGERRADDLRYCTLCDCHVDPSTKHCMRCNKCVIGFDHHCRWLNNCVGSRNYKVFASFLACTWTVIALFFGVGVYLIVRFAGYRDDFNWSLKEMFDVSSTDSGSQNGYFAIVIILVTLSFLVLALLTQLGYIHVLLTYYGITTYQRILNARFAAVEEKRERDMLNMPEKCWHGSCHALAVWCHTKGCEKPVATSTDAASPTGQPRHGGSDYGDAQDRSSRGGGERGSSNDQHRSTTEKTVILSTAEEGTFETKMPSLEDNSTATEMVELKNNKYSTIISSEVGGGGKSTKGSHQPGTPGVGGMSPATRAYFNEGVSSYSPREANTQRTSPSSPAGARPPLQPSELLSQTTREEDATAFSLDIAPTPVANQTNHHGDRDRNGGSPQQQETINSEALPAPTTTNPNQIVPDYPSSPSRQLALEAEPHIQHQQNVDSNELDNNNNDVNNQLSSEDAAVVASKKEKKAKKSAGGADEKEKNDKKLRKRQSEGESASLEGAVPTPTSGGVARLNTPPPDGESSQSGPALTAQLRPFGHLPPLNVAAPPRGGALPPLTIPTEKSRKMPLPQPRSDAGHPAFNEDS